MSDAMIEKVARAVYACRCRTNNVRADWDALDMEERVQFKVEALVAGRPVHILVNNTGGPPGGPAHAAAPSPSTKINFNWTYLNSLTGRPYSSGVTYKVYRCSGTSSHQWQGRGCRCLPPSPSASMICNPPPRHRLRRSCRLVRLQSRSCGHPGHKQRRILYRKKAVPPV